MAAWKDTADLEENDLSDFNATGGSGLTAPAAAAKNGSYGMAVAITDTNDRYGLFNTNVTNEKVMTVEFWLDPNNLTMDEDDELKCCTSDGEWSVYLGYSGGEYFLYAEADLDSGTVSTDQYVIPDEWNQVRLVWGASTGAGNDDGFLVLMIDGEILEGLSDLDNDTQNSDLIAYGSRDSDSGTSGTIYFDDCRWLEGALLIPDAVKGCARTKYPSVILADSLIRLTANRRDTRLVAPIR